MSQITLKVQLNQAIFQHNVPNIALIKILQSFSNMWRTTVLTSFVLQTDGLAASVLTHCDRGTQICVGKLTIIGSDNGLSPGRRQAIIWTNAGILSIVLSGTNFSEILIEICALLFKKMHLKMSSGKWRPFCLGLNALSRRWNTEAFILLCHFSRWLHQIHNHRVIEPYPVDASLILLFTA